MNDDVVEGTSICPKCKIPLMEKIPQDKRQIREVIRFFCVCGYYEDVPINELQNKGRRLL
jgi:RNase P subunit RPR2